MWYNDIMITLSSLLKPISLTNLDLPALAVLSACAILFSILDVKNREIPREFSIAMISCVFIAKVAPIFTTEYTVQSVFITFMTTISGGVFAFFTFSLVFLLSRGKMGLADVWFAIAIGIAVGIQAFIIASLVASVLGIIWFIGASLINKTNHISKKTLPFIPFLSFGFFTVVIYLFIKK